MARLADPDLAQRRRRQIVEAAMVCFRRRGFHQTSMQEICAEAGISAGALYRYFPSKADIIFAISEQEQRAGDDIIDSIATGGDVADGLVRIAVQVAEKCTRDRALTAEVLAEITRDPAIGERFAERLRAQQQRIASAIAAGQRRGAVARDVDAEDAARLVMLMIDGIVLRAAALGENDMDDFTDAFSAFVEKLLKPQSKPTPTPAPRKARVATAES